MTQRLLVQKYLEELRSKDQQLDQWVRTVLRQHVDSVFQNMRYVLGSSDAFTAAVRGSGTAGTYEIASQLCRWYRTGDLVHAFVDITLAGSLTAGGTTNLHITGLPYPKMPGLYPIGTAHFSGVDLTPGVHVVSRFDSDTNESSTLQFAEVTDNSTPAIVPISAVAANDRITASIAYVTSAR